MTSKIQKFISSALNNSSANEAAQALKMAAVYMQESQVSPADFLQRKGEPTDNADLREAKEVAIKWHRIAHEQEQALEEALEAASLYQKAFVTVNAKHDSVVRRFKAFAGCALIACIGLYAAGNQVGETAGRITQSKVMTSYGHDSYNSGYAMGYDTGKADAAKAAVNNLDSNQPVEGQGKLVNDVSIHAKLWHPRGGIYGFTAVCLNGQKYAMSVNLQEKTVTEDTQKLTHGFTVNLPSSGAAWDGKPTVITTSNGYKIKCTVHDVYE